jgi:predicted NUDIX family phosphoesterase/predicted ATPase
MTNPNQKSILQIRAETAVEKFRRKARRPIIIEFAGVPKAGKTTTLSQVSGFLKRCGFRVETVVERASVCPIRDKKHFNFNIWTACTTLAQILEKTQQPPSPTDPDILFLDRGLFDALAWLSMMEKWERIRKAERKAVEEFLTLSDWRKRINGVVVMTTSPKDAMSRERGHLPVQGIGSIMNEQVVQQMLDNTRACVKRFQGRFNLHEVDTSSEKGGDARQTANEVAELVLSFIENELEEEVLSLPKAVIKTFFEGAESVGVDQATKIAEKYSSSGSFIARELVEVDQDRVQALPVVIIRNKSGQVLQLKRKEKNQTASLHDKLVIWAGGHVRKEDSANGQTLIQCAIRELQEELRLRVDSSELKLLGAIYADHGGGLTRHMALVYEWSAASDDVEIVLNATEFFERRGNSQSGRFIGIEDLHRCVDTDLVVETWSVQIIKNLLSNSEVVESQPNLF